MGVRPRWAFLDTVYAVLGACAVLLLAIHGEQSTAITVGLALFLGYCAGRSVVNL